MKISSILLTTLLLFLSSNISANTIFKCKIKNKKGTYTYQEKPCSEKSTKDSSWSSKARQNTFTYSSKSSLRTSSRTSSGSFTIPSSRGGAYLTQGKVNSTPVVFLVDTGATFTSIPQSVADKARMVCGKKSYTNTANGKAAQCESTADISFGVFELPKEKVMVLPNLHQPVLGMNTLRLFHIEHSKGNMKITYQ